MKRVATLLVLAACAREPAATPARAYMDFATAIEHGDADVAWKALSHDSQDELTRAARAVATAEHKPAPADGRFLAFEHAGAMLRAVARADVVEQQDARALVEVVDDAGAKRVVIVVRDGDAWRVDLSDALKNAVK